MPSSTWPASTRTAPTMAEAAARVMQPASAIPRLINPRTREPTVDATADPRQRPSRHVDSQRPAAAVVFRPLAR